MVWSVERIRRSRRSAMDCAERRGARARKTRREVLGYMKEICGLTYGIHSRGCYSMVTVHMWVHLVRTVTHRQACRPQL
jgi:hypothetical protein